MRVLNLGSLNIDKVYTLDHFVQAGETISSTQLDTFAGGKGLNQSVALARAGAEVYHAGAIGGDGMFLKKLLEDAGVNTRYLQVLEIETGHAIIQLNRQGENCIILSAGANDCIDEAYIDSVLEHFEAGDILLLQNEISGIAYAMEQAHKKGMKIAFNASPVNEKLFSYPLELVDYYLINEGEGKALAGAETEEYYEILKAVCKRFPQAAIVLTVGSDGVLYQDQKEQAFHGIYKVNVVDTTAAGDTFCGYFLSGVTRGLSVPERLEQASKASAMAVSVKGAANSIPTLEQVLAFQV